MVSTTIKMIGDNRIGGILVPFGSSEERDLDKEYFAADTGYVDSYFKMIGNLPVMAQHNHIRELVKVFGGKTPDNMLLEVPVGVIDTLEKTDEGWYAEAILKALEAAHEWYVEAIQGAVNKGVMHWAGGYQFIPQTIRKAKDGKIKYAPVIEGTLTPTPTNPYRTHVRRTVGAFKALNLPIPEDLLDEESAGGEEPQEQVIEKTSEVDSVENVLKNMNIEAMLVEKDDAHLIISIQGKTYRAPYKNEVIAPLVEWKQVEKQWLVVQPVLGDAQKQALALIQIETLTIPR